MTNIMANIRVIFRSRWMRLGVACEIFAFFAALGNWYDSPWLVWQFLPNVALTLATLGAVIVAGRVAWEYHGRELNERQREDVNAMLSSSSLSPTQREEVEQITESSGLNQHQREAVNEILSGSDLNEIQKDAVSRIIAESGPSQRQLSELPSKLIDIHLSPMISAQQAAITACNYLMEYDYLRRNGHGRVAVLTSASGGLVEVQCIDPPKEALNCPRQHNREDGDTEEPLKIAASHLQPFAGDTIIWLPPAGNGFRYTNRNIHRTLVVDGRRWVFSREDCAPKRLDPVSGDYVLTCDESGKYTWEQRL